ncbi:MAG: hypothetical protein ABIY55_10140 [Kofleriaceae bacterium]
MSQPIDRKCGTDVTPAEDSRFVAVDCEARGTYVWDTSADRLLAELPGTTRVAGPFYEALPVVSAAGDVAAIARGNTVELYAVPDGRLR